MSRDYLDILTEHNEVITEVSQSLYEMARAHRSLGNQKMANRMFDLGDDLVNSFSKVNSGYGKVINDRVRQTEDATKNMLSAFVAGLSAKEPK